MPFLPLNPNIVVYQMADGQFLVDNDQNSFMPQPLRRSKLPAMTPAEFVQGQVDALESLIAQIREAEKNQQALAESGLSESFSLMNAGTTYSFNSPQFTSDDLWLEVLSVDLTNLQTSLRLHGTVDTNHYQILFTNRVETPGDWTLGPILPGDSGTNQTDFPNIPISTNSQMFYRAHQANPIASVSGYPDAYEPNALFPGQDGLFLLYAYDGINDVTVYYRLSGTASNGLDYTNLSGVVTVPVTAGYTYINVHPIQDNLVEGIETVTLTIIQTNDYLIEPSAASATLNIFDSTTTVSVYTLTPLPAIEPDGPPTIGARTGVFQFLRDDASGNYPDMDVFYQVSGTASNGVDYTALSGLVHFAAGIQDTNSDIIPLSDNLAERVETVVITLIPTNTYVVKTNYASASLSLLDSSTTVSLTNSPQIAIEADGPPGIPARPGIFVLSRYDTRGKYPDMDVNYQVSGTASNGVDYVTMNGVFHFVTNIFSTNFFMTPLADSVLEGAETVTLTLSPSTHYLIDTNSPAGTVTIIDTSTTASIVAGTNAVEPYFGGGGPFQVGNFKVSRSDIRNNYTTNLVVYYQISGVASNGVDYTNLPGTVTIPPFTLSTNIFIAPLGDNLIEGDETVTLTLLATNGYYVNSNSAVATIVIIDTLPTNGIVPVVTNLPGPIGIDYYAPLNSLIVSYNLNTGGNPYNFARIYLNGTNTVVTNWSGVAGLTDEVKLATVKTTVNGFTNGDMYFGSNTGIGWLSTDGTTANLNWCILTNSVVTNALLLRGSLYVDQTGTFSNQVIAVTSVDGSTGVRKGVWRVDAQAHPTLLTNLLTPHLEGVITLTNDVQRWGPWAGKIITGDEDAQPNPVIYTIATNGAVKIYDTTALIPGGIHPEDFDIILTNQNLYACAYDLNMIVKLPAAYLANYVGDLLVTEAGENGLPGKLFVIHWDAVSASFVTRRITYDWLGSSGHRFEHVTFAPIDLPAK